MKNWFCKDPIGHTLAIFLILMVGSCTARHVYCDWSTCTKCQKVEAADAHG